MKASLITLSHIAAVNILPLMLSPPSPLALTSSISFYVQVVEAVSQPVNSNRARLWLLREDLLDFVANISHRKLRYGCFYHEHMIVRSDIISLSLNNVQNQIQRCDV
ncbi:hypothetical protein F5878DRAFT_431129 [Lentinula raphanica]|uniref:Uncharacterized protein n=1 Tax=Lentinula raphanica TaxID=153919 RepID=A0AA38PFZ4_9AGAR|nr:hypothetical protein F5878DRAFT_431129 [Lentinula raphanica]